MATNISHIRKTSSVSVTTATAELKGRFSMKDMTPASLSAFLSHIYPNGRERRYRFALAS